MVILKLMVKIFFISLIKELGGSENGNGRYKEEFRKEVF